MVWNADGGGAAHFQTRAQSENGKASTFQATTGKRSVPGWVQYFGKVARCRKNRRKHMFEAVSISYDVRSLIQACDLIHNLSISVVLAIDVFDRLYKRDPLDLFEARVRIRTWLDCETMAEWSDSPKATV